MQLCWCDSVCVMIGLVKRHWCVIGVILVDGSKQITPQLAPISPFIHWRQLHKWRQSYTQTIPPSHQDRSFIQRKLQIQ
ncbi:unnamed protein product [Caenorhabditis angaria]|uniref:Uncharacterized protein n=1 Tax=Caenorhabditis angaria TaxID=860376 RepID=A0A9P1IE22_9PELO|nr:unnamed protein product [Caenorhabditis angaria]